jgi:hypothetical protein
MTQYLLSVFHPEDQEPPPPEELATIMADVGTVNERMADAGVLVFAGGLQPSDSAAVVRATGGEATISKGPFAGSTQPLGGFWIIQAADADEAMAWATKAAEACRLPVEARPFQDEEA